MRRFFVLISLAVAICVAWLLAGCIPVGLGVAGSGRVVTKDMGLSNFTAVEAQNAFQVDVTQGDSYKVSVTADDNLWDRLDVATDGQTLRLALKPGAYVNTHLQAQITMPSLSGVMLSGASQANLSGFKEAASSLTVRCSGASSVNGEAQDVNATFELSGASKATLRGAATSAQVTASGASAANLGDFPVDRANVNLSGASKATLNVKSSLDYDLSGASNLDYSGSPSIGKSQTSGASNATHR